MQRIAISLNFRSPTLYLSGQLLLAQLFTVVNAIFVVKIKPQTPTLRMTPVFIAFAFIQHFGAVIVFTAAIVLPTDLVASYFLGAAYGGILNSVQPDTSLIVERNELQKHRRTMTALVGRAEFTYFAAAVAVSLLLGQLIELQSMHVFAALFQICSTRVFLLTTDRHGYTATAAKKNHIYISLVKSFILIFGFFQTTTATFLLIGFELSIFAKFYRHLPRISRARAFSLLQIYCRNHLVRIVPIPLFYLDKIFVSSLIPPEGFVIYNLARRYISIAQSTISAYASKIFYERDFHNIFKGYRVDVAIIALFILILFAYSAATHFLPDLIFLTKPNLLACTLALFASSASARAFILSSACFPVRGVIFVATLQAGIFFGSSFLLHHFSSDPSVFIFSFTLSLLVGIFIRLRLFALGQSHG